MDVAQKHGSIEAAVHHKIVKAHSLNSALSTSIYRDTNISCQISSEQKSSCVILMIVLTETC